MAEEILWGEPSLMKWERSYQNAKWGERVFKEYFIADGKIEWGVPQAYIFPIDKNGEYKKEEAIIDYLDNFYILLKSNITNIEVGKYVVFCKKETNFYGFGKLVAQNKIELDFDSNEFFIASDVELVVFEGMCVGSFVSANISYSSSGVDYKGAYKFSKALDYTDATLNLTLNGLLFNDSFVSFLSGNPSFSFGGGEANSTGDYNTASDKEIKPVEFTVVVVKKRIGQLFKWEEFVLHRASVSKLSSSFTKNDYYASDYTFEAMTKTIGGLDVLDYNVDV